MKKPLHFRLNRKPVKITTDPNRTLLWVLRTDLGVTGPKYGCGEGLCGACTVLVNDEAVLSCQTAVSDVDGAEVITIEGLAQNGSLHPLQKAFIEHDALQCGFCTPGMILKAYSLLTQNALHTREDIVDGMDEHLCRCGAHKRIIEAIETAARLKRRDKMKSQDIHNDHDKTAADASSISRRQFLKQMGVLGGGMIVYFSTVDAALWARTSRHPNIPYDFNAYLKIDTHGRVMLYTGKIEMGQGPITSLPQMLAEELDVTLDSVDILMGDTDLCPWDMGTWGSLTTRQFGPILREAAAEAKRALKELASAHLKCPISQLQCKNGVIFDKTRTRNRVTYARLTQGKHIERHVKEVPPLKPTAAFTIMGRSYLRRDADEKVRGKAKYAGDIRLPGMLYAKILRPPAHGARLTQVDTSAAEKIEGVQVVRDGNLVAVLHKYPDVAANALAAIKARFDLPQTGINDQNIFDHLLKNAPTPETASAGGSLSAGEKLASSITEATYLNHYVAHAPMEPHTALAAVEGGRVTVWSSTQSPFGDRRRVAEALNLPLEKVRIITPYVGGGFGGKSYCPQAVEAAQLAKKTGRPVQVAWSRAEEFFFDGFRPAAIVKIKAGTGPAGKMVLWDYHVYYAGRRGCEQIYDIPHHRERFYGRWRGETRRIHPFGIGPWRAPANNTNTYARDLHINLMASQAGFDPLEFRLRNLQDKRMITVLKAAAKKFGWRSARAPSGRGFGISCGIDAGTYVAIIAAVDVDKNNGNVDVKRVVCAQDMGFVVNPAGARIQMEGCITMGLGYALSEEIRFKDGKILDLNFDTYEIPRFSWLPQIETVFVKNDDLAPQGGGEPAIICMGGAIASAIHDKCGARLFQLPMTPDRVKAALSNV